MRGFLASHPRISIPAVGSNMWTYFYRQYGSLAVAANLDRCLADMLSYKHVRFLEPDEARIRAEFAEGDPTYARLFALFLRHHAERKGMPRWGAQTGLIERYAEPLFAALPDLKVIHMIRDPRDRYEASLAKWPEGRGRAGGAAARFAYSAGLATSNQKRFGPDRYLIVRFEDLIADPEKTVREVCQFLGEQFHPEMMSMPDAPEMRAKLGWDEAAGGPVSLSPEYLGRYLVGIPALEAKFIEIAARRQMQRFSYLPAPNQPRPRLGRLVPVLIGQGGRYVAWIAMERVQQRFPRIWKRRPGRRMLVEPDPSSNAS